MAPINIKLISMKDLTFVNPSIFLFMVFDFFVKLFFEIRLAFKSRAVLVPEWFTYFGRKVSKNMKIIHCSGPIAGLDQQSIQLLPAEWAVCPFR